MFQALAFVVSPPPGRVRYTVCSPCGGGVSGRWGLKNICIYIYIYICIWPLGGQPPAPSPVCDDMASRHLQCTVPYSI